MVTTYQLRSGEVADDRLDLAVQRLVREVEALAARQRVVVPDSAGDLVRVARRQALGLALGALAADRLAVQAPHVAVERDDARRSLALGAERVVAVPGADVEHALALEVERSADRRPLLVVDLPGLVTA